MGLKDNIMKAAQGSQAPVQQPSTEGILKQISTRATGKAAPVGVSGQSNVAETMAIAEGQIQQREALKKAQDTATELGVAEQKIQQQKEAQDRERKLMEDQMEVQRADEIDRLLSVTSASDRELADRVDAHNLEMIALNLAFQDKQYTDKISEIGRRERLQDSAVFAEEALRLELGNKTKALLDQIANAKVEGAKARDFKERNLIEDINDANTLVQEMLKDQTQAAVVSGVADFGKAGVTYWQKSEEK